MKSPASAAVYRDGKGGEVTVMADKLSLDDILAEAREIKARREAMEQAREQAKAPEEAQPPAAQALNRPARSPLEEIRQEPVDKKNFQVSIDARELEQISLPHEQSPTIVIERRQKELARKVEEAERREQEETRPVAIPQKPPAPDAPQTPPVKRAEPEDHYQELRRSRSEKVRGFVLSGEEEENDPQEEPDHIPFVTPTIEDFDDYGDAASVKKDLVSQQRNVAIRSIFTGLLALLLVGLTVYDFLGFSFIPFLSRALYPQWFLTAQIGLLAAALLINVTTVFGGLASLFRFKADGDSAVALAMAAAVLQNAVMFLHLDAVSKGEMHVYGAVAVTALLMNLLGKRSMVARIHRNFSFVCEQSEKFSGVMISDEAESHDFMVYDRGEAHNIIYAKKAKFLHSFLMESYASDPCDKMGRVLTPIGMVGAVLVFAGVYILSRDFFAALTSFCAVCCICVPVTSLLATNSVLKRECFSLMKKGVLLSGYRAAERFSEATAIALDAVDLFPKGSTTLHGVRAFRGQRVDEAILDAAAVVIEAGGTLTDIFTQAIQGRVDLLPQVDSLVYEQDMGISGWVGGKRVLVGNSLLMENHGVHTPSKDYESKYRRDGKQLVYLSTAGELAAMFIVSYQPKEYVRGQMAVLQKSGMGMFVRTCDANITPGLISEAYGVSEQLVTIMPVSAAKRYEEYVGETEESLPCGVASKHYVTGLISGVHAAEKVRGAVTLAVVFQTAGVILGYAIAAFLSLYSGLSQVGAAQILIYQFFWILAIVLLPKLKRR